MPARVTTQMGVTRRQGAWFLAVFFGLAILFVAVSRTEAYSRALGTPSVRTNAVAGSAILGLLGETTQPLDNRIASQRFILTIEEGCDALEPIGLYAAAVLASPVAVSMRLLGLLGALVLLVLNQVRVVTLYLAGVHFPSAFETLHLEVWQTLFVLAAISLWLLWVRMALRQRPLIE